MALRRPVVSSQGIVDAVDRGCVDGNEIGKKTVLPASHTGGRRYMIQNYHDGIAICKTFGPPDFFVTFTCNPKWPEIAQAIACEPRQKPADRSDVVVRVYNMTEKTSGKSGKGSESSARRRLEFPSDDEQELQDELPDDALNSGDPDVESLIDDSDNTMTKSAISVKARAAENKRARRGSALLQKSG